MSVELIGFLAFLGMVFVFLAIWLYVEDLKYRLKNMEFDKEMYERLYEIYKSK